MTQLRPTLKRALLGIVLASMIGFPVTIAYGVGPVSSAPMAQGLIQVTPNVAPLVTEESPDDFLPEELLLPEAFIEGNVLIINGKPYPIGDAFYDAEGIPLGTKKADKLGLHGYAAIENLPSHVLVWYLDGTGRRRYIVTTANDDLLAGDLGFDQIITNLQQAETRFQNAVGAGGGGFLVLVVSQLAGCALTGGVTCGFALVTGLFGAIGGTISAFEVIAFDLLPAIDNVERAFTTIDVNRP